MSRKIELEVIEGTVREHEENTWYIKRVTKGEATLCLENGGTVGHVMWGEHGRAKQDPNNPRLVLDEDGDIQDELWEEGEDSKQWVIVEYGTNAIEHESLVNKIIGENVTGLKLDSASKLAKKIGA